MSKKEPLIKEVNDFPVRNKQNVTIQSNQPKTVTVQQKPSNNSSQNINLANSNTYQQQGQHILNVQRNPQESGIFNVGSRSVIYTQPEQKKKGKNIGKTKVVNRNYQLFPPFELIINEQDVDDLEKQRQQLQFNINQSNHNLTKDISNNLNVSKFDEPNLKERLLGDKKTKQIDGKTYVLQEKPQSKGKIQYKLQDPPVKIFDPPSYLEINTKKTKAKDYFRDINEKDGWIHALLTRDDIQDQLNGRTRIFKFLICVTVYSENRQDLMGTLDGIYKNIEIFKNSAGVGYQDVAVVVVFDGCKQIDETVLEYFAFFDEQYEIPHDRRFCFRREVFLNTQRDGKNDWYPKQGCYTYQIHYRSPSEANQNPDDYLQVFLAVKLQNNGKLSSHAFFFRAFCETFQPHYCALIDCGTQAEPDALYRMFLAMEGDSQIGGCCGYMGLNVESVIENSGQRTDRDLYPKYDFLTKFLIKIFCVQRAQKFEYSMSHILDKAFESFFGFIQVLPGAFSAYRWKTLAKKKKISKDGESEEDDNMLEQTYLVSVLDPEFKNKPDLYTLQVANMMLAEDRILCLEIFTRENYILKYIPDSYCNTDPVKYFIQLMKQRRRWINGSWFALDYVLKQFPKKLMKSTHSTSRKFVFIFAMFYATLSQLLTYITIAIYFIFLWMTLHATMDKYYIRAIGPECNLANFFVFVYLSCCGGLIYYSSFTKRPEDRIKVFLFISSFLGIYVLFSYSIMVYVIIKLFFFGDNASNNPDVQSIVQRDKVQVQILVAINFLAYALPVIFKLKQGFTDLFMNAADYIFYSPSYFHTLLIFAFCNIDDLSWGTKGLEATQLQLGNIDEKSKKEIEEQIKKKQEDAAKIEKNFKTSKISFLANWIFYNALLIFIMVVITSEDHIKSYFILGMAYYVTAFLSLRSICAFLYMAKYYAFDKFRYYLHINKKKKQFQQENNKFNYYLQQYRMGVFEKQIVKIQNQKQNKEEIFKRTPQEIMYEYNVVQVCNGKKVLNQNEWRKRNNSNPPIKQLNLDQSQHQIYDEIKHDQKQRLSIKPNFGNDRKSLKQTFNGKQSIQAKDKNSLLEARKSLKKKE